MAGRLCGLAGGCLLPRVGGVYNPGAMDVIPPTRVPSLASGRYLASGVGVAAAFALGLLVWGQQAEPRKASPSAQPSAEIVLTAAPVAAMGFAAAPAVASPTATVARFALTPLRAVAGVVVVRRCHQLTLTRLGGLYGP